MTPCTRPECDPRGEIEDGYCNVCGLAPARDERPASAGTQRIVRHRPDSAGVPGAAGSKRIRIGAGLVELPAISICPPRDAVLVEPSVAEEKRYCSTCNEPVGRRRGETPGRADGFCRHCGHPFCFTPKLGPGDVIGGQYAVVGCLAHGGLGWIYLAQDRRLDNKWVVLKGLLNSGDVDAMAAAVAERRFLAEVDHPSVVKIMNFVEHEDDGYIVMEYVNGRSLRWLFDRRRDENDGEADPFPIALAIAYMYEFLPALGYLHDRGLLYCDFKPDNAIQTEHGLVLIDLGGVYRMSDTSSPVYGTRGYQAPEIAQTGPTIASDLYTVGRTLAVLCTNFLGFQSAYEHALPPVESAPAYARYESLYRLIERATAFDPAERFESAAEMAEQLLGVLREVTAREEGRPVPAVSTLFSGELHRALNTPEWRALPAPLAHGDDTAAAMLATSATTDADELLDLLGQIAEQSIEVDLRRVRLLIESGRTQDAERTLDRIESEDPWDWRGTWYRGVAALAHGDAQHARTCFEAVSRVVPGELAPRLAAAVAAELAGDDATAARLYDIVSGTDPNFASAVFGLARCRARIGDRAGAIRALDRINSTSSAYTEARIATTEQLLDAEYGDAPRVDDVVAAAAIVEALDLDALRGAQLEARVFERALVIIAGGGADPRTFILDHPLTETGVRSGLERAYRTVARHLADPAQRFALVDRANRVRPRTLT